MNYDVSHRTLYRYSLPVSFSHHLLHLTPRSSDRQICHRTALAVSPPPSVHRADADFFGNPLTRITLQEEHTELSIHGLSTIEVRTGSAPQPDQSLPWDQVYPALTAESSAACLDAVQYAFASPCIRITRDIEAYARESFPPGRPVLEGALELTARIYEEFEYDGTATTVSTPLRQVFEGRRGVCQDFAHLQIACLRALRVPARYVSGYLLTHPPEGQERLVGADASHAWLAVYCPGDGWVDLDPTNNLVVGDEHITLAWGRDYSDVSPIRGTIFGGGAHAVEVAVSVTPIDAPPR